MIDKELCCCSIKNENIKCEYNPQCDFLKELIFLRKSLSEALQSKEHILKKWHKYRCTLKEIKEIAEQEVNNRMLFADKESFCDFNKILQKCEVIKE